MTDRCEPPEALREDGSWHWVDLDRRGVRVCQWGSRDWARGPSNLGVDAATEAGFRYVCPVPSPEIISDLITALDRIAHMHRAEAMIAIAAMHKYDPSRRVLNNSPLPEIDTTIKPPAKYYPERRS